MSIHSGRLSRMGDGLILLTLLAVACVAPDEGGEKDAD